MSLLQVMVGGTNQGSDLSKLKARAPDILVATPGRLNDNLTNSAVSNALKGIRSLIFDEADRLLDMGFRCACGSCSETEAKKKSETKTCVAFQLEMLTFGCLDGNLINAAIFTSAQGI